MQVKGLKVYWENDFSNDAILEVIVDNIPDYSEIMEYECKKFEKIELYYASDEKTGLVNFYLSDFEDHRGFGGRSFKLNMKDGSVVTLVGPWSSRPAIFHKAGFPFCTNIYITEERYNHCSYAAFMLNSKLEELIKEFLPELQYYIAANGKIYIPKNQPLNMEYKGSYAEYRANRELDPPKYDPEKGIDEDYNLHMSEPLIPITMKFITRK